MGAVAALTALGVFLAAQGALAAEGDIRESRRRVQDPERLAPFGLMLDAGVPGGAGLSVAFSPVRSVRLHLGATHNGIRPGARAGLTLLPGRGWMTPAFTLEVGHAQAVDARHLERRLADPSQLPSPAMERVGYSYASALVGVEIRTMRGLTLFVRGGLSLMELESPGMNGLSEPFQQMLSPAESKPWSLRTVQPTGKLGLVLTFG